MPDAPSTNTAGKSASAEMIEQPSRKDGDKEALFHRIARRPSEDVKEENRPSDDALESEDGEEDEDADEDDEDIVFEDAMDTLPSPISSVSPSGGALTTSDSKQSGKRLSLLSHSTRLSPVRRRRGHPRGVERDRTLLFLPTSEYELKRDANLDADINEVRSALRLFLNSHFSQAEECLKPKFCKTLYHTLGFAFIVCVKALMTFDPSDMDATQKVLQKTVDFAGGLRANSGSGIMDSLACFFRGGGPGVTALLTMNRSQRHAELVHAEAHLLKAVMSVLNGDSILSLVKEGLAVKASHAMYRDIAAFLDVALEGNLEPDPRTNGTDRHLTSGVALGMGMFNLFLSMLPERYLKMVELIGFTGDRLYALGQLESVGRWDHENNEAVDVETERHTAGESDDADVRSDRGGLRRPFADMALLSYHTILSSIAVLPFVDLRFAKRVLDYNLARYPKGVLFLYFSGRLHAVKRQIPEAIHSYQKAIDAQRDWRQIQHACYWEMSLCSMLQRDWDAAYEYYSLLAEESRWSKAVYMYSRAVMLYEEQSPSEKIDDMMRKTQKLVQKIAGRSIPVEKFVSRKARQYLKQKGRLVLPALELVLVWHGMDKMPAAYLERNLAEATKTLTQLRSSAEEPTYHDDVALAQLIRGCCARELAFLHSTPADDRRGGDASGSVESGNRIVPDASFLSQAREAFAAAIAEGKFLILDHYVVPMAFYERGVMHMRLGSRDEAMADIIRILDGGFVDDLPEGVKKYSLDGLISLRAHNARDCIMAEQFRQSSSSNTSMQ